MKRLFKILGWTATGFAGVVVLAYLTLLIINRSDQPPSDAALTLATLIDSRPPVVDGDNAAIYVLGFNAAGGADPAKVGAARRDWMEAVNRDHGSFEKSPGGDEEKSAAQLPLANRLREQCSGDARTDCRDLFDEAGVVTLTADEHRLLVRYEELLRRPSWREVIPLDLRLPLPAYGNILNGQRLRMLKLRGSGAEAIRQGLHADHEFWREAQKSSDVLISKMIAVVALRQHYFFGNLVIRSLPRAEQLSAVPAGWGREFSAEELAMHRVMAGELRFAETRIRELFTASEMQRMADSYGDVDGWGTRFMAVLARPLYQPQDQINYMAERYLAFADRFRVPLTRYLEAEVLTKKQESADAGSSWALYNPAARFLRDTSGSWSYADYALRVAVLEGMRRASLLTTRLRATGVAPGLVAAELEKSELRDPFRSTPFEWIDTGPAVVYASPDKATVTRHAYFY